MSTGSAWLNTLFALVVGALAGTAKQVAAHEYTIDPARTTVSFEVRSLGVNAQRGTFNRAVGTVALDAQSGNGRFDIVIDAQSVAGGSAATDRFLRGGHMLNAEQFPQILYRGERVVFAAGAPGRIDGELTLRGVTLPVPLTVTDYHCIPMTRTTRQRCSLNATAVFKRSAFGMTRYLRFTSDDVALDIRTEGVSSAPSARRRIRPSRNDAQHLAIFGCERNTPVRRVQRTVGALHETVR